VLAQVSGDQYRRDLYNIGLAVNLAFSNPKELDKLLHPPAPVRSEDLPLGPVRIPKDRTKRSG
jgi:hypothetical protein